MTIIKIHKIDDENMMALAFFDDNFKQSMTLSDADIAEILNGERYECEWRGYRITITPKGYGESNDQ